MRVVIQDILEAWFSGFFEADTCAVSPTYHELRDPAHRYMVRVHNQLIAEDELQLAYNNALEIHRARG